MTPRLMTCVILAGAVAAACGGSAGPRVENARMGQPAGPNGAVYFTIVGGAESDRLIGASTDVAAAVEIHREVVNSDGTTGMEKLDALDVPAGGDVDLAPGGYHLMLIEVDRLEIGDVVELALSWETAGEMIIEAQVVDPLDVVEDP